MPTPRAFKEAISRNRWSISREVSVAVGSSRISNRHSPTRLRAISTICWWPTPSALTGSRGSMSCRPIMAICFAAAAFNSACRMKPQVLGRRSSSRFSATLIVGTETQFLHHHAHADALGILARRGRIRRARERHRAGAGRDEPGDDLGQRALAGAVLAGEREHLARAQLEVDVGENGRRVGLADAAPVQQHGRRLQARQRPRPTMMRRLPGRPWRIGRRLSG